MPEWLGGDFVARMRSARVARVETWRTVGNDKCARLCPETLRRVAEKVKYVVVEADCRAKLRLEYSRGDKQLHTAEVNSQVLAQVGGAIVNGVGECS